MATSTPFLGHGGVPTCRPLCPICSPQLSRSVNQIRLLATLQLSEGSAEIQTLRGPRRPHVIWVPLPRQPCSAPGLQPSGLRPWVTPLPAPPWPTCSLLLPQNPASMSLPQGPPPWPPRNCARAVPPMCPQCPFFNHDLGAQTRSPPLACEGPTQGLSLSSSPPHPPYLEQSLTHRRGMDHLLGVFYINT